MFNRQALIVILAAAAGVQNAHAFTAPSPGSIHPPTLRTTVLEAASSNEEDVDLTRQVIMDHIETPEAEKTEEPIMDTPPTPAAVEPAAKPTPVAAKKAPKKKGGSHKAGVFSPLVVAAGAIMGEGQLKKTRAKVIGIHSDLVKSFVATSDSEFGKGVLRQLFNFVDTDNSGYLDKSELTVALDMLGFTWLGEKEVDKIFARADENGDSQISLEEFMVETPKTLKMNLIKLAKANGGDMGLMV